MAVVTEKDYSSLQDIREEAGHQHLNKLEELTGLRNGSNTNYYVKRTYIVDSNYDDVLNVDTSSGDVVVYVNDSAVEVSAIDANTGKVSLANAPANGATVLGTYYHSSINDTKVAKYRKEAISYVQRKINGIINFGEWTDVTIPPIVQTVVRIYAAGLILIRDQGLNADTENTSKDGYKRLSTAKSLLAEYIEEESGGSGSTSRVSVKARSDGNIFPRNTDLSGTFGTSTTTDEFMRKD
jgi:hypothetical protein